MISASKCKSLITTEGHFGTGKIFYDGRYLGKFVTHGHKSGNGKTVFSSRIARPFGIAVEATTKSALVNKIARELSVGANERGLSIESIGLVVEAKSENIS